MALPKKPQPAPGPPKVERVRVQQPKLPEDLGSMPEMPVEEAPAPRKPVSKKAARPPQSEEQPVRKPARKRAPKKKVDLLAPEPTEGVPEGWKRDRRTGVLHKYIPKTEMDAENRPVLHLEDLNLDDLTGEAEKYLAHLRIPPSKEEQAKLREERARRAKAQNDIYEKTNPEEDEPEGFEW